MNPSCVVLLAALGALGAGAPSAPAIHPGAVAVGVAGSLVSIAGTTTVDLGIDAATFRPLGPGLAVLDGAARYARVQSLERVDLEAGVGGTLRIGTSGAHPYVALRGGLRQEWIGSFRETRYPLGFDLGVRALVSAGAGVRIAYSFRRLLGDPVAGYSEHRVGVGVSIFLANDR